jgi:Holliday junction resolvase-like predicted endonuclease
MPTIGWLLENDRISWMCEKLAGLYLRDSGYDILEVDHGNEAEQKINIIANENGDQTVFVKVETIPIDHDDNIEFSIKDDEAIRLKKSVESYYSGLDVKEDHRIDMIFIRLNKNNPPSIKHFKGII